MSNENVELVKRVGEAFDEHDVEGLVNLDQVWTDWQVEDLGIFDTDNDRVAATFLLVGTGRQSGVRAGQTIGLSYRMRDGKLWRMRSYLKPTEAHEAVGLPGCRAAGLTEVALWTAMSSEPP